MKPSSSEVLSAQWASPPAANRSRTVVDDTPSAARGGDAQHSALSTQHFLDVQHLQKVYAGRRRETVAVADLHFAIGEDEFLSIVGPSGCGKTTMLRMVAGLLPPT